MKRILSLAAGMMCLAQVALAQSPEDTVRWIYTSLTSNAPFSQQGLQATRL